MPVTPSRIAPSPPPTLSISAPAPTVPFCQHYPCFRRNQLLIGTLFPINSYSVLLLIPPPHGASCREMRASHRGHDMWLLCRGKSFASVVPLSLLTSLTQAIEGTLRDQKGIHSIKIALLAERGVIEYDPSYWSSDKLINVSPLPPFLSNPRSTALTPGNI